MKENKFQAEVIKALKLQGAWIYNVPGGTFGISGIPDLLVIQKMWKGWLELKSGSGRVSTLQKYNLKECRRRGFPSFVLRWYKGRWWLEDPDEDPIAEVHPGTIIEDLLKWSLYQ